MRSELPGRAPGAEPQPPSAGPAPGRAGRRPRAGAAMRRSVLALAMLALADASGTGGRATAHAAAEPPPSAVTRADTAVTRRPTPPIHELKTRLDLKEPFDLAQGKVRIVVFFSPTCSHCIANADGLQEHVLDKLDTPDIEVYAVWLKILDTDNRRAVDRATWVLHDPRVHHYWDDKMVLNAQLLDAIDFDIQLRLYNIQLLYDRAAAWGTRLPRPPFWMQEYRGAPGPLWDPTAFADEVVKALDDEPLDTPAPH